MGPFFLSVPILDEETEAQRKHNLPTFRTLLLPQLQVTLRSWLSGVNLRPSRAYVSLCPWLPHLAPVCAISYLSDSVLGKGDTKSTQMES